MDERDVEKEGQNGKRKGGIERKMFFFLDLLFLFLDKTVITNPKAISKLLHFLTQDIFFSSILKILSTFNRDGMPRTVDTSKQFF
jgi:hypothetical protein